jgi:WD40 repeat protein
LRQGRYSDAIVKFGLALVEDRSNRDAAAGKKEAEDRMIATARAAPPDPATIRESIQKDLALVETSLAGFRETENFGQARDLLTQAARRRTEEEWSREIASRLESLRKAVDEAFVSLRAKAVAAKKAGDAAGVESARTRLKNWKWSGLGDELDLELARTRETTAPPPPPPLPSPPPPPPPPPSAQGIEIKTPTGIHAQEPITGSTNALNSLAFSPDGKLLLTTGFDSNIRIWDVGLRAERTRLAETFSGRSCAWSPDGLWIASGSFDGILRVWDAAGHKGRTLTGQDQQFIGVAFTLDSKQLVSSNVDGSARLWDVGTGLPMREMRGHPRGALGLSLSPDGRYVAVGTGEPLVKIWEISTGKEVRQIEGTGQSAFFCVSYAPDGKSLAFGGSDGTLYLGDPAKGTIRTLGSYRKPIHGVAWSPDGRIIATTSEDPSMRLWDPSTGAYTAFSLEGGAFGVTFSPKGDILAVGAADWSLRLYDLHPAGK